MANFKTREIDLEGKVVTNTYAVETMDQVKSLVSERGNRLLRIEEVAASKEINLDFLNSSGKPKPKALALFCKQLHTMLNAGMPLITALDVLAEQQTDKRFKKVIEEMSVAVQKGDSLSNAMKAQGSYFPNILISMVTSGELTGNLDEVMERMSEHFTKENKINNRVKSAARYPIILALVAIGAVVFLLIKVLPTFVDLFEDSGAELPGITQFVINFSNSLVEKWYIYVAVIVGLIVIIKVINSTKEGRLFFDKTKIKFPMIKGPMAQIITSRFTRTMSTLLGSGIPLLTALETAADVTGNKYVVQKIEEVSEDLRKGAPLSGLLGRTGVFPPMMVSMVGIGEEAGALEELLDKTADYYDSELDQAIDQLMGIMEPVMILVVGGMIAVIVIAMLLPMLTMFSVIQ